TSTKWLLRISRRYLVMTTLRRSQNTWPRQTKTSFHTRHTRTVTSPLLLLPRPMRPSTPGEGLNGMRTNTVF
ncbi:uncharacterized protein METZ01_LOCUS135337, partial [marine metagenome]